MNKENILLIGLFVLVIIGLVYSISGVFTSGRVGKQDAVNIDKQGINTAKPEFEKKTSESEVTIDLTPKEFKDGKLYVDIGVNTHSVDLSQFDLASITILKFDEKEITPISAPKLSGHHNSGVLVFDVGEEPKKFKIEIKGVPEINERLFEWP